ncbi:unnamed protein product [Lymnaea stagnalis]|uniref:Uncharacterized protein n=1 Tax=Lymnaea stagnalis TaxID=6523 RepID=A0AAV2IHS6_LYMST
MAKLFLVVVALAMSRGVVSGDDTTETSILTSEDHIKFYVREAQAKCNKCEDTYDTVLSRTMKSDICNAFFTYKLCILAPCYAVSTSDDLEEAKNICDGCNGIRVSTVVLILAVILSFKLK